MATIVDTASHILALAVRNFAIGFHSYLGPIAGRSGVIDLVSLVVVNIAIAMEVVIDITSIVAAGALAVDIPLGLHRHRGLPTTAPGN